MADESDLMEPSPPRDEERLRGGEFKPEEEMDGSSGERKQAPWTHRWREKPLRSGRTRKQHPDQGLLSVAPELLGLRSTAADSR